MRLAVILPLSLAFAAGADLRLGIIGTDTSHATAFASILNDPSHRNHVPGARIVAAFKGGSPDIPESANRVEKYAEELKSKWNVELVTDIPSLCGKVDAILLESVDGRSHLAQARQAFQCGKPVFIDKPFASTYEDAKAIAALGKQTGVKWFTSSSLRFSQGIPPLRIANMNGVLAWGPGPQEAHHALDLTWYGIHTVEILYTLMGRGCEEVTRTSTPDVDVVTGRWKDGKLGTIRVIRPYSKFGAVTFSPKELKQNEADLNTGYHDMLREIIKFFQTGITPIPEEETLEMFAFMDAAQRSKAQGGKPVRLE